MPVDHKFARFRVHEQTLVGSDSFDNGRGLRSPTGIRKGENKNKVSLELVTWNIWVILIFDNASKKARKADFLGLYRLYKHRWTAP